MTDADRRHMELAHRLVDAVMPLAPDATPREFYRALLQTVIAVATAFSGASCTTADLLDGGSAQLAEVAAKLRRPDARTKLH